MSAGLVLTPPSAMPVPRDERAVPVGGRVYLHPGEFAIAADPCTMTTILGSCVSVCLFDPVSGIGGMNHYLLPRAPEGTASARYGDVATRRLVRCVLRAGAQLERLRAKVVGGACVLAAYRGSASHIGRQNVRMALDVLEMAQIPVTTVEVAGERARKIRFHPESGDLVVRHF